MNHLFEITDFHAPQLDVYARYNEVQLRRLYEPDCGIFIAESPKVIERALEAGCEPVSLLIEKKQMEGEARDLIARCSDIPVYTADYEVIRQLTGFPMTRGALCAMRRPMLKSVQEICEGAARIAVLENIVNPTNVGAIFRSAAALQMDAVLLSPACSDPLYRRASRVSMGTVFQIPWTYFDEKMCQWPQPGISMLRKLGFKTAAMALSNDSISVEDPRLSQAEKLAIVLGTEGAGLTENTISACDYTVRIPMANGVDSLNVAAASAVAFWQLRRR